MAHPAAQLVKNQEALDIGQERQFLKDKQVTVARAAMGQCTGCELLMTCTNPNNLINHGQQRENFGSSVHNGIQFCPLVYYSRGDNVKSDL